MWFPFLFLFAFFFVCQQYSDFGSSIYSLRTCLHFRLEPILFFMATDLGGNLILLLWKLSVSLCQKKRKKKIGKKRKKKKTKSNPKATVYEGNVIKIVHTKAHLIKKRLYVWHLLCVRLRRGPLVFVICIIYSLWLWIEFSGAGYSCSIAQRIFDSLRWLGEYARMVLYRGGYMRAAHSLFLLVSSVYNIWRTIYGIRRAAPAPTQMIPWFPTSRNENPVTFKCLCASHPARMFLLSQSYAKSVDVFILKGWDSTQNKYGSLYISNHAAHKEN